MPSGRTARVTFPTDEQVLITRGFDAPRHLQHGSARDRDAHRDYMDDGLQEALGLLEQAAVSLHEEGSAWER